MCPARAPGCRRGPTRTQCAQRRGAPPRPPQRARRRRGRGAPHGRRRAGAFSRSLRFNLTKILHNLHGGTVARPFARKRHARHVVRSGPSSLVSSAAHAQRRYQPPSRQRARPRHLPSEGAPVRSHAVTSATSATSDAAGSSSQDSGWAARGPALSLGALSPT